MKLWTNTFTHRVLGKSAFGAAMLACALAAAIGPGTDGAAASTVASAPAELPNDWDGQPVRPLALSAVEQRFAQAFPGHIARLTDGRQIVVLREVRQPTRLLHPAVDCYRALGYRIEGERLERMQAEFKEPAPRADPLRHTIALRVTDRLPLVDADAAPAASPTDSAQVQRCFTARKDGVALRVCEQIEDAAGRRFADTSAWYWAAAFGRSPGPWRAVTVTRPWQADDA
ncbi:hypothetical protein FVQ98_09675 [Ottowia sp. GY511]|uniref:Uncharacterized protein n=1 Tax=Ottowia flava TaxID=2675430 RepID=A0ABW4L0I2_9BURK|nr:hypothetical protein [Ottowia sp. GY511]TXK28563.1 hypothetical protein FVQ98_09675 [Ottowia sp. GY511]